MCLYKLLRENESDQHLCQQIKSIHLHTAKLRSLGVVVEQRVHGGMMNFDVGFPMKQEIVVTRMCCPISPELYIARDRSTQQL